MEIVSVCVDLVFAVFLLQSSPSSVVVCLEFDQCPWNKAHPLSNSVFIAAVLLLSSPIRRHRFKVHSAIFGYANSPSELCWRRRIKHLVFLHLCSLISSVMSPLLPLPFSLSLFLTGAVFPVLSLSRSDLLAMNQGWGSMPGERWGHSGKWLFPARLHHIRIGNGRKGVCARVHVCVCIIRPAGDQLCAARTESTTVSHRP